MVTQAWRQLCRFPLRTALMLACGGLSAALVIVALNYTAAGRAALSSELNAMGADWLTVTPALSRNLAGRARTGTIVTTLRAGDATALRRADASILVTAQVATVNVLAKAGDFAKNNAAVVGVEADYFSLRRWPVLQGALFSPPQERRQARVALLGAAVARDLFPARPAVGQRLLLNRVPFTVLGVLAARGQRLDAVNEDDQIYIPFSTLQRRLVKRDYDSALFLRVAGGPAAMAAVARRAAVLLRRRHHLPPPVPDDFKILDQATLLAAQQAAQSHLQQLVRAVGLGGLLAAAAALLALHTLALGARKRELGIRRALGATPAALRAQLATEAAFLGLMTALLALAVGVALTSLAQRRAALPPSFDPRAAALVITVAVSLDFAGALIPAHRASRRDPADSLSQS